MPLPLLRRRDLLASVAIVLTACDAHARNLGGAKPWSVNAGSPPEIVRPGPWRFFAPEEAAAVEAIVDRLIPPDTLSIGGREAGCAVFIDAQLAGSYGDADRLYMRPPFASGTPMQGYQGALTPAQQYRQGLAALDAFCRTAFVGKGFAQLGADQQDKLLAGLESGTTKLDGADGRGFFELLLQNTMEGFFADPVYGGNKGMAGWKLIGFPGARYDYRDHIARHNEPYPLPPVGIAGRPDWTPKG